MSTATLDVIKKQLDRMEKTLNANHDILMRVEKLQQDDHAAILEILDAVTLDEAANVRIVSGPPREQEQ